MKLRRRAHRLRFLYRASIAASFVAISMLSQPALAELALDAVGLWTFVSSINEQNGRKSDTYGLGATGVMVLDASTRYAITIIGAGLPKLVSNNRNVATVEEARSIVARSNAHFGTYSIDPRDGTITFKIESATFPNWNGTEQKRSLTISGNELRYAVAASSAGGSSVVTWRRAQ